MRKVIVAFESHTTAHKISKILESDGLAECVICHTASEVRRLVNKQGLKVVVCGFKFPDGSGELLYHDLPDECVMLMIEPQNRLELCETEGIFQLLSPTSRGDLLASVEMLLQVARQRLSPSSIPLHCSEKEEELVTRAKELLMDRHGMTEKQAYRFLQTESVRCKVSMEEISYIVLGNI